MPLRIISWNTNRRADAWRILTEDQSVDLALLQEAVRPAVPNAFDITPSCDESWLTTGSVREYRTAIAWRRDRVNVTARHLGCIGDQSPDAICVSRSGTLTAVDVHLPDGAVTLVSAYSVWERPRSSKAGWLFADSSAHRLISDISGILESYHDHRLILAGDFNVLHGYGDHGNPYWKGRYDTVFARLHALGFVFVGPQFPAGGRQALPWPAELPLDSKNVPTFHSNRQSPASATRQLDFVFASKSIASGINVRARNEPDDWGPSDHCRIEILCPTALPKAFEHRTE